MALLMAAGLVIVVQATPLAEHFARAGSQLAAPDAYRQAVLGGEPVRRIAADPDAAASPAPSLPGAVR
jgi:hypothetical protein